MVVAVTDGLVGRDYPETLQDLIKSTLSYLIFIRTMYGTETGASTYQVDKIFINT